MAVKVGEGSPAERPRRQWPGAEDEPGKAPLAEVATAGTRTVRAPRAAR